MSCIITYKDKDNECSCNKLKECSKCNNKDNRKTEKECKVSPNEYCTCRTCAKASRG